MQKEETLYVPDIPHSQTKRDFGSFHASNVQELLSLPEHEYIPPPCPFTLPSFQEFLSADSKLPVFGKKAKKEFFLLEDSCCFLNHGAFGGVLKQALETVHKWQEYTERQPLRFYDRLLLPLLVHVCRRLASFVGCDPRDLVLVNNVTFGMNSVLNSFPFSHGDVILTFNITYGATKKLVQHVCSKTGAINREAVIQFPVSGEHQILDLLEAELASEDVRLVIIDHIPSNAPILMPVAKMVEICHKLNVRVLIDGAHALGALPLDLSVYAPDYYVSNAHKWLCCPKGVAFLYVKRDLQEEVIPAVVSHGLGSGFNSEFIWAGLHDYSPMLSLHTVLDFWLALGPDRIRNYMRETAREAGLLLAASWQSQLAAPEHMFGSMVLVELPASIQTMFSNINYDVAEIIQNILYNEFDIEVPVKSIQGHLYVRISAHIYNERSDYEKLAHAVTVISQRPVRIPL
ncbi:unnamed protein product [Candidula unifasciata]|uniref:Aminotransferase class V domain-containing protein n=1 Tax=Candidula unifasciata TaxID=100452 RepID=A0A8S3ZMU2_9EUPU|nr:unnamed protein product [Candidula unifasciata]